MSTTDEAARALLREAELKLYAAREALQGAARLSSLSSSGALTRLAEGTFTLLLAVRGAALVSAPASAGELQVVDEQYPIPRRPQVLASLDVECSWCGHRNGLHDARGCCGECGCSVFAPAEGARHG